ATRRRSRCWLSNLEAHAIVQLELPLGLGDEGRRPGAKKGVARSRADRAIDAIRKRFGGKAVDYGSAVRAVRSVPRRVPTPCRKRAVTIASARFNTFGPHTAPADLVFESTSTTGFCVLFLRPGTRRVTSRPLPSAGHQ